MRRLQVLLVHQQTVSVFYLHYLIEKKRQHEYLYWEYHDPKIGSKAIRLGKWKGILTNIRKGNTRIQLYNLENDIREEHDVATQYPNMVKLFERLMLEAPN